MSFVLITDSSCNLLEETIDEFDIHILPLTFLIDDKEYYSYVKGQKTDLNQFYALMREGKVVTTSLPKVAKSLEHIEEILRQGNDILYLGFSSALSGTYESIAMIQKELQPKYPNQKFVCVETKAAALGEGMIVYYAAQMARNGATIEEIAQWVENNRLNACHWFTVDDLMFLYRGGRVSRTSAFAGSLLKIKPVLHVDDEGALIPMSKVKGRKKSLQALADKMAELGLPNIKDQKIFISHGDCLDDAEYLCKLLTEKTGCTDFYINCLDPVIGAHAGPGTVALFFMGEHR